MPDFWELGRHLDFRILKDLLSFITSQTRALWESAEHTYEESPEYAEMDEGEDFCRIDEMRAQLYGAMSTLVHSVVERELKRYVRYAGGTIDARAGWPAISQQFKKATAKPLSELPGYETADQVRMLNNCFKHNDGICSDELAEISEFEAGEDIQYQEQQWENLISAAEGFLHSAYLVAKARGIERGVGIFQPSPFDNLLQSNG